MNLNYNEELNKVLGQLYQEKIIRILIDNNISELNEKDIAKYKSLLVNTKVYLGSDMNNFILNLFPEDKLGYFFKTCVSKHHNHSYPILYDYKGNELKNPSWNKYAIQLWASHMDDFFIKDVNNNFSQDSFTDYIENNLSNILDELNSKLISFTTSNEIIIPLVNKDTLIDTIKDMISTGKLDKMSWSMLLVDLDMLRAKMDEMTISLDLYNEFDKLEDDYIYCIDNFPKYTCEELFDLLIAKKDFVYVEGTGLVKK